MKNYVHYVVKVVPRKRELFYANYVTMCFKITTSLFDCRRQRFLFLL